MWEAGRSIESSTAPLPRPPAGLSAWRRSYPIARHPAPCRSSRTWFADGAPATIGAVRASDFEGADYDPLPYLASVDARSSEYQIFADFTGQEFVTLRATLFDEAEAAATPWTTHSSTDRLARNSSHAPVGKPGRSRMDEPSEASIGLRHRTGAHVRRDCRSRRSRGGTIRPRFAPIV